jgi:hypothetical protein
MLPWASPFQGLPAPALHELSPALLPRASQRPPKRTPAAPRSITRPMLGFTRLSREGGSGLDEATLLGFWHLCVPEHSNEATARAILFTSRRAVHHCRLTNALWTVTYALPKLPGIHPEVPSIKVFIVWLLSPSDQGWLRFFCWRELRFLPPTKVHKPLEF